MTLTRRLSIALVSVSVATRATCTLLPPQQQQQPPPQDKAPASGGIPGADFVDAGSKKRGKKGGSGGSTPGASKQQHAKEKVEAKTGDARGGGEFNTTNWWTTVEAALADDSAYEPRGWNTLAKPEWVPLAGALTPGAANEHRVGHVTPGYSATHAPAASNGHSASHSSNVAFPVSLPPDTRFEEELEGRNLDPDAMVAQLMDMGYSIEDAQVAFQCRTLAACVDAIATKTDPEVLASFRAQELAAQQLQQWRQRVNSEQTGEQQQQQAGRLFSAAGGGGGGGGGADSDEWIQVGGSHGKHSGRSKAALAAQLAPGTAAVLKRLLESGLLTEAQLDVGTVRKLVNAPPKVAFDVVVGLEKCLTHHGKTVRNVAGWLDVGLQRVLSFHSASPSPGPGSDAGTSDAGGWGVQAHSNGGQAQPQQLPRHYRNLHPDIVAELLLALQAMRCTPEELDELATRELEVWQRLKGVEFTTMFLEDMKHHSTKNVITNAGAWMFGCMKRFDSVKQQSAMEARRRAQEQQRAKQPPPPPPPKQQQQQRQASPTRSYASSEEHFGSYYGREPAECNGVQQQYPGSVAAYPEWASHVNENRPPEYTGSGPYYSTQPAATGGDAVPFSTGASLVTRPPTWSQPNPHMVHGSYPGMPQAQASRAPPGFGRAQPEAPPPSVAFQAFSSAAPFSLFANAAPSPPVQPVAVPAPGSNDDDLQFILSQLGVGV